MELARRHVFWLFGILIDNEQENNEDLENNEETSSGNDGHALIPFP